MIFTDKLVFQTPSKEDGGIYHCMGVNLLGTISSTVCNISIAC